MFELLLLLIIIAVIIYGSWMRLRLNVLSRSFDTVLKQVEDAFEEDRERIANLERQ